MVKKMKALRKELETIAGFLHIGSCLSLLLLFFPAIAKYLWWLW
jgi:hypothetical protein